MISLAGACTTGTTIIDHQCGAICFDSVTYCSSYHELKFELELLYSEANVEAHTHWGRKYIRGCWILHSTHSRIE